MGERAAASEGAARNGSEWDPLTNALSRDEALRYSRHLTMPEVSLEGQKRLKAASVLCVGVGGLGSPLTLYLAAAGVGRIGIVDPDAVDLTNIQRQVLYATSDVGRPKVEAAKERLTALNPEIEVVPYSVRLSSDNAMNLFAGYDLIADGTDNFPTRYLVNDACVLAGKPNVYASVLRFEGQVSVFDAKRGPCYRCLFPEPPPPGLVPSCADAGVLGVLPGIIGSLQALEAIKWILGRGESLIGRLILFDALTFRFRELSVRKDPHCPICGTSPTIRRPSDYEASCGVRSSDEPRIETAEIPTMAVEDLDQRLKAGEDFTLIDVREPHEREIVAIEGSRLIPLGDLAARLHELDAAKTYVLFCHHGIRSAQAALLMRQAGFRRLFNLAGGIDAWADRVDPTLARY